MAGSEPLTLRNYAEFAETFGLALYPWQRDFVLGCRTQPRLDNRARVVRYATLGAIDLQESMPLEPRFSYHWGGHGDHLHYGFVAFEQRWVPDEPVHADLLAMGAMLDEVWSTS